MFYTINCESIYQKINLFKAELEIYILKLIYKDIGSFA